MGMGVRDSAITGLIVTVRDKHLHSVFHGTSPRRTVTGYTGQHPAGSNPSAGGNIQAQEYKAFLRQSRIPGDQKADGTPSKRDGQTVV